MRSEIDVCLQPGLVDPSALGASIAVVVDVLRATTTMCQALGNGASAIVPCGSVEEASLLGKVIPGERVLVCGERDGLKPAGYDLGNGPGEFSSARVRGCVLVMATTNGTPAILRSRPALRTIVASFLNLESTVQYLDSERKAVTIICAGEKGGPSWEDTLLAGHIAEGLRSKGFDLRGDGARIALEFAVCTRGKPLVELLRQGAGGQRLLRQGFGDDIDHAARRDSLRLVAVLRSDPARVEIDPSVREPTEPR